MKKISLIILCSLPLALLAQSNFNISGNVRGVNPSVEKVYISYAANGQNVIDSASVIGNRYRFDGIINEPTRMDLRAAYRQKDNEKPEMSRDLLTIFIEPTNIEIKSTDSFSNATVTGSRANVEFQKLQSAAKPFENRASALMGKAEMFKKEKNSSALESTEGQLETLQSQMKEAVYADYIRENPNSPLAFFALQQYSGAVIQNPSKVEALFKLLPATLQQSRDGQRMHVLIEMARLADVGKMAPAFTQSDADGNPVSLTSFKGKYVLVNFWASWCGPCRAQNPELTKLYDRYKNDGFEIIGVSLDKPGEKDEWLKAIQDDGLTWTQVTDLRFWSNAVARQYGVVALPQNFLIDENGKIIAKNLKTDQLSRKLKSIFGN
ncbi:redoxin domain-containing protein [Arachidicoccus sp.]|jgi:peroxiredoxin|uniref:redoxin domain-containing protein n=1 Tax=Arachidicoccus sp. TaxID=1872624 RepID=UPI003D1D450F